MSPYMIALFNFISIYANQFLVSLLASESLHSVQEKRGILLRVGPDHPTVQRR